MSAQVNGLASSSASEGTTASKVQPGDVGWQFVPQYYNFVNKQPHRLHCFYNKRSTFVHGEEGEEASPAYGQQEIHDRINAIGYNQCKVYIHSIDSQSSANGGIIILVIGEMSNNNQPWRKFTQTFFLAEQPNGYFVLNDIFRYLKEDVEEDDVAEEESPSTSEATKVDVPAAVEKVPEPVEEDIPIATAAPEPTNEPAHPDPASVPEEAVIAAVPDKDVAPEEPPVVEETPAVEEPAKEEPAPTPAPEQSKAVEAPTPSSSTPAPVLTNGTVAPAVAAPAAAPPAQPAAPAKAAAPKSWASMAAAAGASGRPAWGAPAPAVTAAPVAAAVGAKKEEAAAAAPAPAAASSQPRHQFYENAMRVQTPHCFVKLPNWSIDQQAGGEVIDENTLKVAATRFGEVVKVEIVKSKACAFVEFKAIEAARKAIVCSLAPAQGGEGGVKVGAEGNKLIFETRKEKDERKPKGPGGGNQQGGNAPRGGGNTGRGGNRGGNDFHQQQTQQGNEQRGQGGGRGGGRGGRGGRGGQQGGQGDRQQK